MHIHVWGKFVFIHPFYFTDGGKCGLFYPLSIYFWGKTSRFYYFYTGVVGVLRHEFTPFASVYGSICV